MNIIYVLIIAFALIVVVGINKKYKLLKMGYLVLILGVVLVFSIVVNFLSYGESIAAISYYNENGIVRTCELPIKGKILNSDAVSSTSYKIKDQDITKFDDLIEYSFNDNGVDYNFLKCEGEFIQYQRVDNIVSISENIKYDFANNGDSIFYISPNGMVPVIDENTISFDTNVDSIIKLIESKYAITVEKDVTYSFPFASEYTQSGAMNFIFDGNKIIFTA